MEPDDLDLELEDDETGMPGDEPEPQDDLVEEDEPEGDPEPEPDEDADDDPDDSPAPRDAKGKLIPEATLQKILKKKLRKHKEKMAAEAALRTKLAGDFESYKKTTTLTPEVVKKFQGLETVFGRFNEAANTRPWVMELLWALGSGAEPDLKKVAAALQQELAGNAPRTDPAISRQLAEMQKEVQAAKAMREDEEQFRQIVPHLAKENAIVDKLLPLGSAQRKLLDEMAARMTPERGTLADLPDRVALARQIRGLSKATVQAELGKRLPKPGAARAGVKVGRGGAPERGGRGAAGNDDPPDYRDKEAYAKWLARR